MDSATYQERRGQIETYFDRTAADAWAKLTSDAPVSGIRATVRAGRDRMRAFLLDSLPSNLEGKRLLDAGCGTGMLAVEAARRGAEVIAIDLSPSLIALAHERRPETLGSGSVDFRVGDMLDPELGLFDHVVAMDSLIHYAARDVVKVLGALGTRTQGSMLFTFAPRTPALSMMHAVGRLFPRGDRAPSIEPVSQKALRSLLAQEPRLSAFGTGRSQRVESGFYISQALELARR